MKRLLLLVLVVALGACTEEDPPAGSPPPDPAAVDDWLQGLVPWGFRGAVTVVSDTDELAAGYGSLAPAGDADGDDDAASIGIDTRFGIGSNTKPLTGLAILMLEDRDQLDVDDRLGDLLADVPADKADITVRQLLTHTAGFESAHGLDEEQIDRGEALSRIFDQELLFPPGSGNSYSNSGYTVLAAIVEEVAGTSYDDFLRTEIFEPAGMDHSGFRGEPVPAGQHEAVGSDADGATDAPSRLSPVGWAIQGNGGVVSSVADLQALEQAIAAGDLLSPAARERWNEPLVDEDLGSEGYGWVFAEVEPGVEVRSHAGGVPETRHNSLWAVELGGTERAFVVSTADGRFLGEDVVLPIRTLLDGGDVPGAPRLRPVSPDELATVAGTYRSAETGAVVTVEALPDAVRLTTEDGRAFPDLFPLPDTIPGIAPPEEVVRLVETLEDGPYQEWLDEQASDLGPFLGVELVGVAPVDEPEPATFVRHRFERGSRLTAWAFSPEGESMSIELAAEPPGVTMRPAAEGGFVSFSVTSTPLAESVTFGEGAMTIRVDGRTVEYRQEEG